MRLLSPTDHLSLLHVINHLMIVPAVIYGNIWWWLATAALWFLIATVGISIGWHRNLAHRSFNCPRWLENTTALLGCLSFAGSPIGWVGVHRMHHANSDNELDPHSPKNGFLRSYFHRWGYVQVPRKYVKNLFAKPFIKFLHRNYFKLLYGWMAVLLIIDPLAVIFFFSMVSVLAVHGFASVNALSHTFGYRNFDTNDDSRNNWWANILTAFSGEGWHNNHHAFPGSHRFGNIRKNRGEIDAAAWIIEKMGFAKERYSRDV